MQFNAPCSSIISCSDRFQYRNVKCSLANKLTSSGLPKIMPYAIRIHMQRNKGNSDRRSFSLAGPGLKCFMAWAESRPYCFVGGLGKYHDVLQL